MSKADVLKYWKQSAKETEKAAEDNFQAKHYDWAFFLWHLTIEKLLKGLLATQNKTLYPTHDLVKLAKRASLQLTVKKEEVLHEATSYNIEARYDDYKRSFYKKVTGKIYRIRWRKSCQEMIIWLKKQY